MQAENIFEKPFTGTHGTPQFSAIDDSMWMPAIDRGIELARQEIDAITRQRSRPDFENTIVALERTGEDLNRVLNVFYPLLSANASDKMMEVAVEASAKLSDYSTSIVLNEALWHRIKAVYDDRELFNLNGEDRMLLQKTYDSFALSGAMLQGDDREKYRALSSELSALTTEFGQNVLKEMSTYEIWLTADDLAGLPASSVNAAAEAAEAKGHKGEYLFTLDQPVYMAFMKYSARPDLRERMYRLYTSRNTKGATHTLKRTMAEKPEAVFDLLGRLREAYRPALDAEMKELTEFASGLEGKPVTIKPWDYSYYSNKLKAEKYSFDEEELRPYFELDKVVGGVFGLATKLYGLRNNRGISPRRKGLRCHRRLRPLYRSALHRFLPPRIETPRCLDDQLQGAVYRRKRHKLAPARNHCDELHEAYRRHPLATDTLRG